MTYIFVCFILQESNGDVKLKNLKPFKDFSSYNSFDQYNNAVINNTRRNIKSRILFEVGISVSALSFQEQSLQLIRTVLLEQLA